MTIDNMSFYGDIGFTKRRSTSSPIGFQIAAGAILPPPPAPAAPSLPRKSAASRTARHSSGAVDIV
jgi:hypothetical protein